MKVIIAAEIFPPDIGGPATYSARLAQEIHRRRAELSLEVSLVCYSDHLKDPADGAYSFPIQRVARQRKLVTYWRYVVALWRLAEGNVIIYAQGPVSAGLPALLVSLLKRKKMFVKVVGDYSWERARNSGVSELSIDEFQRVRHGGKTLLLRSVQWLVCRRATAVITPSQYLKTIVRGWGINDNKIVVIYNSFDVAPSNSSQPRDAHLILSVARLVPWKGFETLITLMPSLLTVHPDFRLMILGDGPLKMKLRQLIEAKGLQDVVTIGAVAKDELLSLMGRAGMFILNTGYEGLSHTILEAMASGVPVITTNVCGNPEVVTDGVNGLLVEYDNADQLRDAIVRLHNDPSFAARLADEGKKTLARFSYDTMFARTIALLQAEKK